MRTIVYVDGFNLYYGALKRSADKWLDLTAYFRAIQPTADLKVVRYFSALVTGQAGVDQQAYLDALATTPLVNITLALIDDAYRHAADHFVLVSGDTDLVPALRLVKSRSPRIRLSVYIPDRRSWMATRQASGAPTTRLYAPEFRAVISSKRVDLLPIIELGRSQFAATLSGPSGTIITKPADW